MPFSFEEQIRANVEILIILDGDQDARGTIEVRSYEEKVAWTKALETLNLTLQSSLAK